VEEPHWSSDGRELLFLSQIDGGDIAVLSVSVTEEPTFSAGTPEVLFAGSYAGFGGRPNWDVSPDGQRFLMIKNAVQTGEDEQTSIAIVDNWFEELKRLAPTE